MKSALCPHGWTRVGTRNGGSLLLTADACNENQLLNRFDTFDF